ncbi:four-carbon acid sugar kinase family protein [Ruegeria sp. 2205SS24-7]|uniref:3-oxo-tetronate kinase n=1 Tax=Ruegeria discodermiae TaxID=3064389 RepID=UPI0027405315|nr:3-oxo-tetronate kinase [Ruegeria sp. 2205SS24-7]MDP5218935.1 four-carbon acid sugar kinase family protein [Ruegeria sp. 2205SS24-7]
MKIGVIADDFTGASDIALTLAEAGMRVSQFIGIPETETGKDLDAGVVALKSRTCPVSEAVQSSLTACDWLLAQGAQQIIFKVCSTFDSTDAGNIGPVLDALAQRLDAEGVIVCPAFPENGRSVYQGHLFVQDKLLNESGMQDHPLTPMRDADLRRVLSAQSARPITHIDAMTVMRGAPAIRAALPKKGHVIADAIRDDDLVEIGKAANDTSLLCGGSGIAIGLPANFGFQAAEPKWDAVHGPGVVLSGSCSNMTRRQVETYKSQAPHREISARAVINDEINVPEVAVWALQQDKSPLIYSSADPEIVKQAQAEFGKEKTATAIEAFFAQLAAELMAAGLARMVVAGGETSGAVVNGLKARALRIGPRLAAGVPVLRLDASRPVALALKSGNFGSDNFFANALTKMGEQR